MAPALRRVCARFVELCREMGLLTSKRCHRWEQVQGREQPGQELHTGEGGAAAGSAGGERSAVSAATRQRRSQEPTEALAAKVTRLKEKLAKVKEAMGKLVVHERQMLASPDQQISLTDPDSRSMATSGRGSGVVGYKCRSPWIPSTI